MNSNGKGKGKSSDEEEEEQQQQQGREEFAPGGDADYFVEEDEEEGGRFLYVLCLAANSKLEAKY